MYVYRCVGTAGDIAVSRIQHISFHRAKRWMVTQHFVQSKMANLFTYLLVLLTYLCWRAVTKKKFQQRQISCYIPVGDALAFTLQKICCQMCPRPPRQVV